MTGIPIPRGDDRLPIRKRQIHRARLPSARSDNQTHRFPHRALHHLVRLTRIRIWQLIQNQREQHLAIRRPADVFKQIVPQRRQQTSPYLDLPGMEFSNDDNYGGIRMQMRFRSLYIPLCSLDFFQGCFPNY